VSFSLLMLVVVDFPDTIWRIQKNHDCE
jgi:hypothetical protein